MTSDELMTAAERYRKLMRTPALYPDVYGMPKNLNPDRTRQAYDELFRRDCLTICDAYLAQREPDDGDELVDEEWLWSIGFIVGDMKRYSLCLGVVRICPPCGELDWWCGVGNKANEDARSYIPVPNITTRRAVRDLLAALGIPTKEGE